jgi:plasmid stabilization system protein ParE
MKYQVLVTERAKRELDEAASWISKRAPEAAARWFHGFVTALLTLKTNPERCGFARACACEGGE